MTRRTPRKPKTAGDLEFHFKGSLMAKYGMTTPPVEFNRRIVENRDAKHLYRESHSREHFRVTIGDRVVNVVYDCTHKTVVLAY